MNNTITWKCNACGQTVTTTFINATPKAGTVCHDCAIKQGDRK